MAGDGGLQLVGPALSRVNDRQDDDLSGSNPVGYDIWRIGQNKLPGAHYASGASNGGMGGKRLSGSHDTFEHTIRCRWIVNHYR